MSKKRRAEQRFCCELRRGALAAGEFWCKIPDCAGPGTQKRPFDAFFTVGDLTVALEAKFWYRDRDATFNLREFKEHQLQNLIDIDRRPHWLGAGAIRWSDGRAPRAVVVGIESLVKLMGVQDRVTLEQLAGSTVTDDGMLHFVNLDRTAGPEIGWMIDLPTVLHFSYWELLHEDKKKVAAPGA